MSRPKGSKNKKKDSFEKAFDELSISPNVIVGGKLPSGTPSRASVYKIKLKCVGRNYSAEGKTFEEAVDKIKISGGARALSVILKKERGADIAKISSCTIKSTDLMTYRTVR